MSDTRYTLADPMNGTYVHYDSNNSGGGWWLTDEDWHALEDAGWAVEWREERFLGALATSARKPGVTLGEAIAEFDRITSADSRDVGCSCCGNPHSFTRYVDDTYDASWSVGFPDQGVGYDEDEATR